MGLFDKIWDITTDVLHGITGVPTAADKRQRANLVNSQMKAYKTQTEIAQKTQQDAKMQLDVEKRRMNDKQISALRRHFSPAGIVGASADLPNTLGA